MSFIVQILFFLAFAAGGYYLWAEGYLADYIPGAPPPRPLSYDYLPDVTSALSEGKIKRAMIQASDALNSLDGALETKKQAALQLAFASYLSRAGNPGARCREIAETLNSEGLEIDAPELAVLFYLSKPAYTAKRLRSALKNKGSVVLAGEIAIFLKNVYTPNAPNRVSEVREAYKRYNVGLAVFPDDAWVKCFNERVRIWYDWLFMRKGDISSLEKLIASTNLSSSNLTKSGVGTSTKRGAVFIPRALRDLTPQSLRASRSFASKRPRPASFDFSPKILDAYFSSLPSRIAVRERKRAEQVTALKRYLCAMMFHMPYTGKTIKLRDGTILRGKVMANPKYLSIKLSSDERKRVNWNNLAPSQFAKMLAFFAKTRTDMGKMKDGAQGYMRTALFCDWYARYDDAVKYAKMAIETDSSVTKEITDLITK
ncbi:MAG: hypothetical protein GXP32_08345 [Kiritimatiellaeota bacterium]|nr:hypothetical protein [Kiritimatiellota bacterium]